MAEEKRDARSAEEAKGAQEESRQGKPWTLIELWGKPRWDWMELLVVPYIVSLATVVFTFVLTQQQNFEERQAQQVLENQRA